MEAVRSESILNRGITWARIVVLLCLVTGSVGTAQEVYFDEDFSDDTANPNVTGWQSFAVTNGILRLAPDAGARGYIRTVNSDYNTRDFVAELTLTCKSDILHFGIGQRGENEPDNSVTFRIHPLVHEGQIRVRTAQTEFNIGRVFSAGPHRVRIRKLRNAITFALDERYDGNFEADMSVTFADLAEVGSFLNDKNSRIFFSTSRPEEELDDFFIRPLDPVNWDCNRNGNEDAADLIAGSSVDANGDSIPDECTQVRHYFDEDFNEPVRNSSLEWYGSFYSIEGGVVRRTGYLNTPFRSNLRTVKTDYNSKDFIFEVSFTTAARDINLIGIGPGFGPDEPKLSVYMRVHSQVYQGQLGIQTGVGYDLLPSLKTGGPHRARIEKRGSKISFAIDEMFDGSFHADMSKTYNDLSTIAPFLNDRNSNLFFGGAFEDDWYDDLSIWRDDQSFRRGDANGDGQSDISDPISILLCLFLGTQCLGCADTQDANDDGLVNIGDAVFLLVWRFGNGSAPRPPFPECGSDPTVDQLPECENLVRCR